MPLWASLRIFYQPANAFKSRSENPPSFLGRTYSFPATPITMAFLPPTASSVGVSSPFVHHLLRLAVLLQPFMLLLSSPRLHLCLASALNCAVLELLCQGRCHMQGSSERGALSQHLLASGFAWLHFKGTVSRAWECQNTGKGCRRCSQSQGLGWICCLGSLSNATLQEFSAVLMETRGDRLGRSRVSQMIAQVLHSPELTGQAIALFCVVSESTGIRCVRFSLAVCCKKLHPVSLCHRNKLWGWPAVPSFYCV